MYICVQISTYEAVYIHMYPAHIRKYEHVCMRIVTYMCVSIYVYIYIYICIQIVYVRDPVESSHHGVVSAETLYNDRGNPKTLPLNKCPLFGESVACLSSLIEPVVQKCQKRYRTDTEPIPKDSLQVLVCFHANSDAST